MQIRDSLEIVNENFKLFDIDGDAILPDFKVGARPMYWCCPRELSGSALRFLNIDASNSSLLA